jgi:hypothetical protein
MYRDIVLFRLSAFKCSEDEDEDDAETCTDAREREGLDVH